MKLRVLAVIAAIFASVSSASAAPENDSQTYEIYVYGFKLGYLRLELVQTPTRYAAAGRVTTTGLLARIAKFNFDGKVNGYKEGVNYWPDEFSATILKKSGESTISMSYQNKTPKIVASSSERSPRDLDPAQQKGTVDMITGAYLVLRDVPPEQLCDKTIQMFDGQRRSQIRQQKPEVTGEKARCGGFYQRIAGFSVKEMSEQTTFPFILFYEMQEDGNYRLRSIETQSVVGSAKMVRRD